MRIPAATFFVIVGLIGLGTTLGLRPLAADQWTETVKVTPVSSGDVDGRVTLDASIGPWRAIGRLNVAGFRSRRHCTATLIEPDLALTAWHCLSRFVQSGTVDPTAIHFLPGYDRGQFLDHLRGKSYKRVGADVVLVSLDRPSTVQPLSYGPATLKPGAPLFQAGYSGDRGHVLTADPSCRYLGPASGGFWRHDCEAISGDSGAPILRDTAAGLEVVAIHIGRGGGTGIAEPLTTAATN